MKNVPIESVCLADHFFTALFWMSDSLIWALDLTQAFVKWPRILATRPLPRNDFFSSSFQTSVPSWTKLDSRGVSCVCLCECVDVTELVLLESLNWCLSEVRRYMAHAQCWKPDTTKIAWPSPWLSTCVLLSEQTPAFPPLQWFG